jgi:hypothetical protein
MWEQSVAAAAAAAAAASMCASQPTPADCLVLCCVTEADHHPPFAWRAEALPGFVCDELHLDLPAHTMRAGDEAHLYKVILCNTGRGGCRVERVSG